MSDPDTERREVLSPAEAFEALGNETRVDILRALADREGDGPVSFSVLREAVGATDSGRFNYHLQKLVGHFLEHGEDGYEFRYAGRRVARAVLAGTFNERAHMAPVEAPGECYECSSESLLAEYDDESLRIWCGDCEETVLSVDFSPAALSNRDPQTVLKAFDRWSMSQAALATDGVCPECAGEMVGRVTTEVPDHLHFEVLPRFECAVCGRRMTVAFGGIALNHSKVLAFHHRHGIDPRDRPYWTIPQLVTDRHTDVVDEDPWRVCVSFHVEDGHVDATIDEDARVVEVTEHAD